MVKRVLPPPLPVASRGLHYPPRFEHPAAHPTNALTLHWEAAGAHLRLIAAVAAPTNQVVDLGIYPGPARTQVRTTLRSRCHEGSYPAHDWIRPWIYHAGVVSLRPHLTQPGVLCILQADGWVSLIAEGWPGRETTGQALGRYPLWEVVHWLGSPPVPSPPDEDTPLSLPTPLGDEVQAVITWWHTQMRTPGSGLVRGDALSSTQVTTLGYALAAELQAHLIYTGWDAEQPAWRAAERALGTHNDPDPVLTRAAFAAGLGNVLLPGWSKQRLGVRVWIDPGQVQVALGDPSAPQIIWPPPSARETRTNEPG